MKAVLFSNLHQIAKSQKHSRKKELPFIKGPMAFSFIHASNGQLFKIESGRSHTLGEGSFGRVKLIRDLKTEEPFALKIIKLVSSNSKDSYVSENKTLQLLGRLIDSFIQNNKAYLIMPFINGENFGSPLLKAPLSNILSWQYLINVLDTFYFTLKAFEQLHKMGIIHGDIKNNNVLQIKDSNNKSTNEIAIIDYGSSSLLEDKLSVKALRVHTIPNNKAPEISVLNQNIGFSAKSDIYALGKMFKSFFEIIEYRYEYTIKPSLLINTLKQIRNLIIVPMTYQNYRERPSIVILYAGIQFLKSIIEGNIYPVPFLTFNHLRVKTYDMELRTKSRNLEGILPYITQLDHFKTDLFSFWKYAIFDFYDIFSNYIIANNITYKISSSKKITPLHLCIEDRNTKLFEYILHQLSKEPAAIKYYWLNVKSEEGFTPLSLAICLSRESLTKRLIEFGCKIDIQTKEYVSQYLEKKFKTSKNYAWYTYLFKQFGPFDIELHLKACEIGLAHYIPLLEAAIAPIKNASSKEKLLHLFQLCLTLKDAAFQLQFFQENQQHLISNIETIANYCIHINAIDFFKTISERKLFSPFCLKLSFACHNDSSDIIDYIISKNLIPNMAIKLKELVHKASAEGAFNVLYVILTQYPQLINQTGQALKVICASTRQEKPLHENTDEKLAKDLIELFKNVPETDDEFLFNIIKSKNTALVDATVQIVSKFPQSRIEKFINHASKKNATEFINQIKEKINIQNNNQDLQSIADKSNIMEVFKTGCLLNKSNYIEYAIEHLPEYLKNVKNSDTTCLEPSLNKALSDVQKHLIHCWLHLNSAQPLLLKTLIDKKLLSPDYLYHHIATFNFYDTNITRKSAFEHFDAIYEVYPDINAVIKYKSVLINCIESENEIFFDWLLSKPDLNLEWKNPRGNTALLIAVQLNLTDYSIKLINKGADICALNNDEADASMLASYRGNSLLQLYLEPCYEKQKRRFHFAP